MVDFDSRELQCFLLVLKERNFSRVASILGVTQPTISLQISRLETKLGGRLFERLPQGLHPTALAHELEGVALKIIEAIESFDEDLKADQSLLKGTVRYAMPESCQWTPHYRAIMAKIKEFPDLNFKIEILPNHLISEKLLSAEIDFGFIVGEKNHPELRFEKFSDETYTLAANDIGILKNFTKSKDLSSLRIIAYPGWELFFSCWCEAQGLSKKLKSLQSTPTVKIGSLAGAIHALQEGAGVCVVPTHCISNELKSSKLFEIKKQSPAQHPVYLARRHGVKQPARVTRVMELLKEAKATLG
ncbi:MAG: LysR family transcriptional regulator [Bdellovibrionota bacterium]